MSRCTVCGLRLTDIDGNTTHPTCDETVPENARIASQKAADLAKRAGLTAAATGSPDDFALALDIIRRAACEMRVFTANDLAAFDARWSLLGPKVPGSAMSTAAKRGYVAKSGHYVPSVKAGTNAHPIPEWLSQIYVDEFKVGLTSERAS